MNYILRLSLIKQTKNQWESIFYHKRAHWLIVIVNRVVEIVELCVVEVLSEIATDYFICRYKKMNVRK